MSKKYKILLSIVFVLILLTSGVLVYKTFFYKEEKPAIITSVLDKMDRYGYSLDDRDTGLYKEKYNELKDVLDNDEIDYEKYGELEAQLFVIDLLTIDNKVNKYDVGGIEFLIDNDKDSFRNKVMDTLYEQVEDNSYETRNQELPIVSNVEVVDRKSTKYEIDSKSYDGNVYSLKISYVKDLGYDTDVDVTVVNVDSVNYVVEYSTR